MNGDPLQRSSAQGRQRPLGARRILWRHLDRPLFPMWLRALSFLASSLVFLSGGAIALERAEAQEPRGDAIARLIREMRLEEAEAHLNAASDDRSLDGLRARLSLYRGNFSDGLRALERSFEDVPSFGESDPRELTREILKESHERLGDHAEFRSADGRIVVRTPRGIDEILAPYAIDILERGDAEFAEIFGFRHPGPIRIDFVRGPEDLSKTSTLSEEAIATTGTIGLCKWDRMLVTTPRALARGYGYLETIAHELAHLYLSRASRDRAPVWFHEGLAKVLEKVPLGQPIGAHLSPSNKALLAKHHEAGTLLPFSAFHPSIALLPTQEQAALAYAEAADFVEQFISEHGLEGLRLAIHQNALGLTIEEALEQVAGMSFHAMEEAWRSSLGRYTYDPDLKELEKRFVDEASEADDLKEMDNEATRKKLRLGDLLWDRGRPKAASVVYREAVELSPKNPILLSRLGRSSLEAGEIEEAIRAGELAIGYYPDHAPALSLLAQAYARADQPSQAIETARRAVGINPFDPAPHCVLGRLVEEPKERETERAACARLTR